MLSKLMRCTENCNACRQYWSTEGAQLFSVKMLDCTSHNQCFKNGMNWTMEFCFICHIHLTSRQPNTTSSSILITFCMENASMTSSMQKCFSTVHQIPKHGLFIFFIFCYRNKQTFLIGKNVLIVMFPILFNKDVFVPVIIILKSRVQKLYYFCTYNAGNPGLISRPGRSPKEWIGYSLQYSWPFLVAQMVKNPPAMWET